MGRLGPRMSEVRDGQCVRASLSRSMMIAIAAGSNRKIVQ